LFLRDPEIRDRGWIFSSVAAPFIFSPRRPQKFFENVFFPLPSPNLLRPLLSKVTRRLFYTWASSTIPSCSQLLVLSGSVGFHPPNLLFDSLPFVALLFPSFPFPLLPPVPITWIDQGWIPFYDWTFDFPRSTSLAEWNFAGYLHFFSCPRE